MSAFGDRIGAGERQSDYHRVRGTTRTSVERRDDDGRMAGYHREHWDDHVDATVKARTVDIRIRLRDCGMSRSEALEVMHLLQLRYGRLKPANQVRTQPRLLVPGRV